MKNKTIKITLAAALLIFISFLIVPNVKGIDREEFISNVADKDTYIDSGDPLSNFGGTDWCTIGYDILGDLNEAYFHFTFADVPSTYERAELSFYFYGIYQTMNFSVCLIETAWVETSLTWATALTKGADIGNIIVSSSGVYTLDISSEVIAKTEISVCVYMDMDNFVDDYCYIYSREGAFMDYHYPQLQWVYLETVSITVTNPTSSSEWSDFNTYEITWTSEGSIENVIIELYKADTLVEELTLVYTDNDGSFDFYVSSTEEYDGSDYQIKITDYDDAAVYDYSDNFTMIYSSDLGIPGYSIWIILGVFSFVVVFLIRKIRKNN